MNLSDFRTRVGRAIGMSTSDSGDLALIDSWVNESVIQFLKDTKVNVLQASLSVTADQADYTLDTDILSLTDIWYEPSSSNQQSYLLEPIDTRELTQMSLYQGSVQSATRYYAMQGAHLLKLFPAPFSSSDLLHVLYVPRPSSVLSATADSPADTARGNIPSEYHPVLESYVKWKAGQAEEHKGSENGLQFQSEYERGVARSRADMNRKAGVFMGRKVHGRRRRGGVSPGVDIR